MGHPRIWGEALAKEILSDIAENGSLSLAMLRRGLQYQLLWTWARNANVAKAKGEPCAYMVMGWPDAEVDAQPQYFSDCLQNALRIFRLTISQAAMATAHKGTPRRLFTNDGKPVYELDLLMIAKFGGDGPEQIAEAKAMGFEDFPYKHDSRGSRVQVVVFDPVPATMKVAALKAAQPQVWNVPELRDVRVDGSIQTSVSRIKPPPNEQIMERMPSPMRDQMESHLRQIGYDPTTGKAAPRDNARPDYKITPPQAANAAAIPRKPTTTTGRSDKDDGIGRGEIPPGGVKMC